MEKRILVVEDDQGLQAALTSRLRAEGYQVETACNKEEAMEKIESVKPDLILLDIMMERPDDGFTICYKLKHDPGLKNIPVLAISAITEKTGLKFSPATDGEYFEADDYVEKPVKPSDLLERVEKLEQLRVLEYGHALAVEVVDQAGVGIDTPADYEQFVARYRARVDGSG